jgi:hypothetical protein
MMEPLIAPVLTHLGMDEILINGSEVGSQNLVEKIDNPFFGFHTSLPSSSRQALIFRGSGTDYHSLNDIHHTT